MSTSVGEGRAQLASLSFPVLLVGRQLWQHMAKNLKGATPCTCARDGQIEMQ